MHADISACVMLIPSSATYRPVYNAVGAEGPLRTSALTCRCAQKPAHHVLLSSRPLWYQSVSGLEAGPVPSALSPTKVIYRSISAHASTRSASSTRVGAFQNESVRLHVKEVRSRNGGVLRRVKEKDGRAGTGDRRAMWRGLEGLDGGEVAMVQSVVLARIIIAQRRQGLVHACITHDHSPAA